MLAESLWAIFKHTNVASHALRERQKQEGKKRTLCLVSEVPTRWNSTFDMLARLLALHVPITAVLNDGRITTVADQMLNLAAVEAGRGCLQSIKAIQGRD